MPVYILLSTLTEQGTSCVIDNPSCLREISLDIENLGVTVLQQYATLGQFDFETALAALREARAGSPLGS